MAALLAIASACKSHQPLDSENHGDELIYEWNIANLVSSGGDRLRRIAMDLSLYARSGSDITSRFQVVLDDAWERVIEISDVEIMRAAKDRLALLVYHLAAYVSAPTQIARLAFERSSDSREPSALDDESYYEIRHTTFRDIDERGIPQWPEELLAPDVLSVSDPIRVRISVVFSGIASMISSGRYDEAVETLEQIMSEPEVCVDRSGAKTIACRIVRYVIRSAPDLTFETRRMVDDLIIAGDPCVNPALISCLWDNPLRYYDNGMWR